MNFIHDVGAIQAKRAFVPPREIDISLIRRAPMKMKYETFLPKNDTGIRARSPGYGARFRVETFLCLMFMFPCRVIRRGGSMNSGVKTATGNVEPGTLE